MKHIHLEECLGHLLPFESGGLHDVEQDPDEFYPVEHHIDEIPREKDLVIAYEDEEVLYPVTDLLYVPEAEERGRPLDGMEVPGIVVHSVPCSWGSYAISRTA